MAPDKEAERKKEPTKRETKGKRKLSQRRKSAHSNKSERAATATKSRRTEPIGKRRSRHEHGLIW